MRSLKDRDSNKLIVPNEWYKIRHGELLWLVQAYSYNTDTGELEHWSDCYTINDDGLITGKYGCWNGNEYHSWGKFYGFSKGCGVIRAIELKRIFLKNGISRDIYEKYKRN